MNEFFIFLTSASDDSISIVSIPLVLLLIFIGGISAGLQAKVVGVVEEKLGLVANLVIAYTTGFAFSMTLWLLLRWVPSGERVLGWSGMIGKIGALRWWELSGGFLGLVIVGTIGIGVARIGTVSTLVIIITSQIFVGVILDHFALLGGERHVLTPMKLTALLFILVGIFFLLKR